MEFVIAIFVLSAVIAFVVGRWWTVLVPIVAVGLFYTGLKGDWWGNGLGDGWPFAVAIVMGVGVLAAALGVAVRTLVRPQAELPALWREPS